MAHKRKRIPNNTAIGTVVAFSSRSTYLAKKDCIIKVFYNALTLKSFKRIETKIKSA